MASPFSAATVHIVGGGLAGSEAAWQLAERGHDVVVHEMRGVRGTPAHKTDRLAELVCSNTFKSTETSNAHGLLKAEMRLLGSLVLECADLARVPGGSALTVDRTIFSEAVHARVTSHPRIRIERGEATELPSPGVVATGPLTSSALADTIRTRLGLEALAFYDAIAPIVAHDSIDYDVVFRASRYGKETMNPVPVVPSERSATPIIPSERSATPVIPSERSATPVIPSERSESRNRARPDRASERAAGEGAYLNCPMSREQYEAFIDALTAADQASAHDFDAIPYFEGCMPAEEMARRGRETLRFGPMKPVGLMDPRTGRAPYAVVQLRQDTLAGDHFSLVGFQTQLKWGEQARVLKLVPGLEHAEFVRFGMVHRNTYINGPTVLRETWQTRFRDDLFFAGQISGVEGYVESAASGLIAGRNAAALVRGEEPRVPPRTTAIGALAYYVSHADPRNYQPTNITFGIMEAPPNIRKRADRKLATSTRALEDLDRWNSSASFSTTSA
jgi:methylenetetrahydrofolate--tRNA-(uracil-5-)-methyltransferase